MSLDVALASCAPLPEPDPDQQPLMDALAERGLRVETLAWDDPRADWPAARLTVLRSTWNYPRRAAEFLRWAERTAAVSRLWNPLEVVRQNLHKSYLLDLERRGVAVVPTKLVRQGSATSLRAAAGEWERVVVKPAISAASLDTIRVERDDFARGEAHLQMILASRDALVQPYLPSVEGEGERALVCVDGALTHAVRKHPRFSAEAESVSGALPIAPDERALAERALATVGHPLLYARVDVARDAAGRVLVMELELIEPSLFLVQHPPALERFADAIARAAAAAALS
jgi:glutathione synthase/RimK-type ligase-like ATP-grasp enzyme